MARRRVAAAALAGLLVACAAPGPAAPPPVAAAPVAAPGPCDACGRTPSAWRWPDGRVACDACHAEAVTDADEARALLSLARDDLRRVLGLAAPGDDAVALRLVDRPALAAAAGEALAHPRLQALTLEAPATARPRLAETLVLVGLPRMALRGVLAHELVHAAQLSGGAACAPDADPAWLEGAALWAHERVLRDLGAATWADRVADADDPATGRPQRRFALLVQARGPAEALRLATTSGRAPPGW